MALIPTAWQATCDRCGTMAQSAPNTSAQEMLVASVQQGWLLQVQAQSIPPTVLLCPRCASQVTAAAQAAQAAAAGEAPQDVSELITAGAGPDGQHAEDS